jgi:uncharacterized protein YqcC (DUF446 family)
MAELEKELKTTGLWQTATPAWVHGYYDKDSINQSDFAQWLQFVFIPNHQQNQLINPIAAKRLLVPQAIRYFGNDLQKGKLLRLLIEIDSLL